MLKGPLAYKAQKSPDTPGSPEGNTEGVSDSDRRVPAELGQESQASSRGEANDSTLLSSRDRYLLEPIEWPKGSKASCEPSASQLLAFSPGKEQAAGVWEHGGSHGDSLEGDGEHFLEEISSGMNLEIRSSLRSLAQVE